MSKFKRIILSNVCSIIPDNVLEDHLSKMNIRMGSKMTSLRAGFTEPGLAHIMSFRRQVFIHPDDVNKLPESLKIDFDNTTFWIYLSSDAVKCFNCKQSGHLAKNCSTDTTNTEYTGNDGITDILPPAPEGEIPSDRSTVSPATDNNNVSNTIFLSPSGNPKRPLSTSDSSNTHVTQKTSNKLKDWNYSSDNISDSSTKQNKGDKDITHRKKKTKQEPLDDRLPSV